MKPTRLAPLAALGAMFALAAPALASANEVSKWNEIAVNTVNAQAPITSAPPAAIDRHGRPYLIHPSSTMAAKDAAAATAAFRVLDTLFPEQDTTLRAAYDMSLAGIPDGPLEDRGIELGRMAAEAMLAQGHDGRTVIGCTFGSGLAGVWQPLAGPTGAPVCDPSPWVGNAVPFVVRSPSQFRTAGPLPLTSAKYAAEVNEVNTIGALNSATRTAAQTHAAVFWQTNPAANYNAMARRFVDGLSLDLSKSARLFAMLDLSAADALITTWNDKYYSNFWRPITAIRRAAIDGNHATTADPTWTPLFDPSLDPAIGGTGPPLTTPPYPEHPSGATAYASASMHAFESFFGTDEKTFYATSGRFPGEQRSFSRFSDLTNEVLEARIWAGIHFRNADVQAANLGREVEAYVHKQLFAAPH
jgi:hypothetical protein